MKLCECGCGKPAPLAKETRPSRGLVKGQPTRFVLGHSGVLGDKVKGVDHPWWKGGVVRRTNAYVKILRPDHPWADGKGYVSEHVLVAEKALGHTLPFQSRVHHVNEIKHDNTGNNLVICQDSAYHFLLHRRAKAYRACGDPNAFKCKHCKRWDRYTGGDRYAHKECKAIADAARHKRNAEKGRGK